MSDLGLAGLGPSGIFISMMATAITALGSAVAVQWKQAAKVYGYRLAERDTLRDALNGNTKAVENFTRASEERNRVTEELADAIVKLAAAFDRQNDRLVLQHEVMKDQGRNQSHSIDDMIKAIGSMADAVRVNTGMVTDVRNSLQRASH